MSWISWDYRCGDCGHVRTDLRRRDEPAETLDFAHCDNGDCMGVMERTFTTVNSTKASYVDGTRRFADVREQRVLQRAARKAQRKADNETIKKAAAEMSKVNKKGTP